jgi:hypothetical protein
MTIEELRKKYTSNELSCFPGNKELRYTAFAPLFENLYENKMIYHEHGVGWLIRVENLEITDQEFSATAVVICMLYVKLRNPKGNFMKLKQWDFSASWDWISLCRGNHFHVPYASFSIWIEEERIKRVEALIAENRTDETYNVVWEEEIKAWEEIKKEKE